MESKGKEILMLLDYSDSRLKAEAYLDLLQEEKVLEEGSKAKKTTITRVTRQTKIDRALGSLATKFAKETDDPLYKKMKKFRDKFFKYRELIKKKYGPRVRSRAISGKGIGDMVKKYKDQKKGKK
jgi:hypothetical protein